MPDAQPAGSRSVDNGSGDRHCPTADSADARLRDVENHDPAYKDAAEKEQIGRLYVRYAPHITAYALRRADASDAADVVADTFLVAWRRSEGIPPEPKTLPWLYGVARRVLANQRRSARRRSQLRDRLGRELEGYSTATSNDDAERLGRVESALNRLPPDDAEILRLTAWEELTPSEIALVLGAAPGTVRQRLRRARIRLRAQLAADSQIQRDDYHPSGSIHRLTVIADHNQQERRHG